MNYNLNSILISRYLSIPILVLVLLYACKETGPDLSSKAELGGKGYYGYLGYHSEPDPNYGMGVSFYTAAWKLVDDPLATFQIGLPGTWIIPDNQDNTTLALCPPGTLANQWEERAPTFGDVFQTLEGGLGYWRGNKYRYGPPKFSMNSTPQCYDYEVASPGWSFFYDDAALKDSLLGIAQLSNRLLVPPDALTFEGDPKGEFMGYGYMVLPLTDAYKSEVAVGDQSWTCFINTKNFKGPIAYYLPETWAKLSEAYPAIEGRGLDSRSGIIRGGAMEINTVPHYEAKGPDGKQYVKVPKLNFPVDENGKAILVQDLIYYNKEALYNEIIDWRKNGVASDGIFKEAGTLRPKISPRDPFLNVFEHKVQGIADVFEPFVEGSAFGFQWKDSKFESGSFPEYYWQNGDSMAPLTVSEIPKETALVKAKFPNQKNEGKYTAPAEGNWGNPGAADGPYTLTLNDGSTVTYSWYKFIDQPVFQQYDWSEEKKAALQTLVEQIHKEWTIDRDYFPPPTFGELVMLDQNLIVTPPADMEYGYVPIVTGQDAGSKGR